MATGLLTIYCPVCDAVRQIKDWHDREDVLLIEVEPCGHVVRRCATLEWFAERVPA